MKGRQFSILFSVILFIQTVRSSSSNGSQHSENLIVLPPCKSCTVFVNSLQSAKEKASIGRDDATTLQLIMDNVCSDVVRGQDQCYNIAETYAVTIEEHWKDDLFRVLCIEAMKVCCPPDHFGAKCEKCQDCHRNGKCKGAGTRKGNGQCSCNPGYTGEQCRDCAVSYYAAFKDESKLLCSKCHDACATEGCTTAGPKGCLKCLPGWRMDTTNGCTDLNECLESRNTCTAQQFCVNNDGFYSCLDCDRSCVGCDGDGPDMCKSCAEGFTLIDGRCTDDSSQQREQYVNMTRFLTYLGLCIATCVIFQSSTTKAYLVGAAVAAYIAASEYWLNTKPAPDDLKSKINNKKLEDLIMNLL